MSSTIDTRFIDVLSWTAQSALLLAPYGTVPKLTDPAAWYDWARVVIAFPAVAGVGAPRPERFVDWREWGRQFNVAARLLTT